MGADVYHLGEAMTRGTRMRFCSTHYRSDFEPVLLSLAQFDTVRVSMSRKPYERTKRCNHEEMTDKGLKRCRELPIYRIEISCEKFVEAMA